MGVIESYKTKDMIKEEVSSAEQTSEVEKQQTTNTQTKEVR